MCFRKLMGLGIAIAVATMASVARAEIVLEVDLSTPNQITISSTTGLSAATISGSDNIGFYLANIFGAPGTGLSDTLVSGNLTHFNNTSDNSPDLFRFSNNAGLNVFSYTNDANSTFTAGTRAFTGSGTWNIAALTYTELLGGSVSGNVYFPADQDVDISTATLIGQYRVIPEPTSLALLGTGVCITLARKRR